jgi:endonuclease/exonuclease/phosphatase family metal-dependent hydrolase
MPTGDRPLRVMTYNIRLNTPLDGKNAWPYRKDRVAGLVRQCEPDLIGFQEVLSVQLDDLVERLPGFAWIGAGRDDGESLGEFSPIFYDTSRLDLADAGTFWLSPTPYTAGSKGWDADLPRVCTWGCFREKASGDVLFHFNTHFDHMGTKARVESARLLAARVDDLADAAPAIITGDFNLTNTFEGYHILVQFFRDARAHAAAGHSGPEGTFFGFDAPNQRGPCIDYIFVRNGIEPLTHTTILDQSNGCYPSDHAPVMADVLIQTTVPYELPARHVA